MTKNDQSNIAHVVTPEMEAATHMEESELAEIGVLVGTSDIHHSEEYCSTGCDEGFDFLDHLPV